MKSNTFFELSSCENIYRISKKDIGQCADLMSRAFHDDPSIRYLLGGSDMGSNDWRYFNTILKAVYGKCAMLSTDGSLNDLLILFPPKLKSVPAVGFFANGGASLSGLYNRGLLKRTINYEGNCKAVKERFVSRDAWYCMCFVVSPEKQGQGKGSSLIRPVLREMDGKNAPLYLETHKLVNTEIYKHLGFDLVDVSAIPGTGISQYAMLRKPGCAA